MPTSFVIDHETRQLFTERSLLLDTNALLDAFRLPAEFYDLANEFAKLGCDLVTTKTVAIEFLGGTADKIVCKQCQSVVSHLGVKSLDIDSTVIDVAMYAIKL